MELILKKTIGKNTYNFVVQGINLHELIMESQKLSFHDLAKCGCCGSENIILSAHVAQGFKYTEVRCLECKSSLTFGQVKASPDTFYYRKNDDKKLDWKKYEPKEETKSEVKTPF